MRELYLHGRRALWAGKKCLRNVEAPLQWLRSPIVPLAVAVTS